MVYIFMSGERGGGGAGWGRRQSRCLADGAAASAAAFALYVQGHNVTIET